MGLAAFGVDRAVGFTVLNRAWGLVAGPATLVFIVANLTPVEQGFYFAFSSVLGLQVFFELGLGLVVLLTVSHLVAGLQVEGHAVSGDPQARARLGRLLADLLRWYGIACVAFIVIVLAGGGWFLGRASGTEQVSWQLAWVLIVPIFGLSILTNASFSFLEGMGFVEDVALARLLQSVIGLLGFWFLLAGGLKLLALVALYSLNLLFSASWILWRRGRLLHAVWVARAAAGAVDWRREIWPFQWRIAVSWMAGYCGSQAIVLILFDRLGPVDAGRFGLSLTAMSAVATGATAWLSTKAPRFGNLVAQRRQADLDALYARAWRGAFSVGLVGVVLVCAVVAGLDLAHQPIARRFVPLLGLAGMAAAMLASIRVSAEATYLRAFRREPYLVVSIASGLLQAAVAVVAAESRSVLVVTLAYAVVGVGIGVLWAHPMFVRLRRDYAEQALP